MAHVTVIGGGIIGSSWAIVFARAGVAVKLVSRRPDAEDSIKDYIAAAALRAQAIAPNVSIDRVLSLVSVHADVADAVQDAGFVMEAVEERLEIKADLFRELDRYAPVDAVLASSTSSFGMSRFASDLLGRHRCIVAHPAAPPHLIPVVEIVPAPFTSLETVEITYELMQAIGQSPVMVKREQPGFVMNRLQGALLTEMFRVIEDGLMSPEDVDRLISDGFGLRWAFLGPLEGIDLNAPGGIADYLKRYGFMFDDLAKERGGTSPVVTRRLMSTLHDAMRSAVPVSELPSKLAWRDERMASLRALKTKVGAFSSGDGDGFGTG
jgi:3-hydroxyacyl-CoA dehydrogenase